MDGVLRNYGRPLVGDLPVFCVFGQKAWCQGVAVGCYLIPSTPFPIKLAALLLIAP